MELNNRLFIQLREPENMLTLKTQMALAAVAAILTVYFCLE
jgi:hypothetical protein